MLDSLFAHRAGSGAQTVVLLHGFGGGHFVWEPIQARLARSHATIAYDLPGHGGSLAYPEAGPPKLAAKAVLGDLDRRGIGRFHVVGHSMGGAVAALIGLMAPERVASLTLVAPGGFGPEIASELLIRYARAREREDLAGCLAEMAAPASAASDSPALDHYAAMFAGPGQVEKLSEIAALLFRGGRQGVIPRESLAGLEMPVKVLWGTEDAVLPFAQTRNLPWRFALHAFAGAGHMLPEEKPDELAFLIARDLR